MFFCCGIPSNLLQISLCFRCGINAVVKCNFTHCTTVRELVQKSKVLHSVGSLISAPFNVANGVRQGGIMSPVLFNVFIDDLSRTLHSMPFGCYISNMCVNHLVYADDMVLLAPSPRALQGLIDTAAKYFVDNGLMINRKKTKCVAIIPQCNKEIHIPSFYVHGTTISRVRHKNYLIYYILAQMI